MSHLILSAFLALMLGTAVLPAQSILFHPATDSALITGIALHDEIWRAATPAQSVLPREAVAALFGDRNANGMLDDGPTRFDALAVTATGGVLVSLASNAVLTNGTTVLDGDVLRIDPAAPLSVVWTEAMFAAATGTSTVDVDAFAIGINGELYFSFEDDEVTSSAALLAQNGGNSMLDEQCVFRLDPTQSEATLRLSQAAVVALFNTAFGGNATSVVDTTGIEIDPTDSTALWITSASSATALRGRIVSTRNGGTPVSSGGTVFEPMAFGFTGNFALDSLALGTLSWPVVRLAPTTGSVSAGGNGQVVVEQASPMGQVQLVVTATVVPGPFGIPSLWAGWPGVHVNPADPLFALSLSSTELTLLADIGGTASYGFSFAGMSPGIQAVVQAVELSTLRVSTPAVLTVTV